MFLLCALLLGVVAGLRSMLAPATVSWFARNGVLAVANTPLAFMGFRFTPIILTLFAVGELIADKLPKTPSRKTTRLAEEPHSFALRWKCFDSADSSLNLQETVYKGRIRKWGKTKKSLGRIHLPPLMVSDLLAWKVICPDSSSDAFIFPNRDGGFLDPNNYRRRVLGRLREILGLPKLTFQVIRRTIATLSQTKGTVKDTQGMMRHERLPTTTNVYMQVVSDGVKKMIDSIHEELRSPSE